MLRFICCCWTTNFGCCLFDYFVDLLCVGLISYDFIGCINFLFVCFVCSGLCVVNIIVSTCCFIGIYLLLCFDVFGVVFELGVFRAYDGARTSLVFVVVWVL